MTIDGGNTAVLDGSAIAAGGTNGLTLATGAVQVSNLEVRSFTGAGIAVLSGTGNKLQNNRIYGNGGLAIDLGSDGPTANDVGDADADGGANGLQNQPILLNAFPFNGQTRVQGLFESKPATSYMLDFFSSATCGATGFGEAQTHLRSLTGITDSNGQAVFDLVDVAAMPAGQPFLAVTATGAEGTSEFSSLHARCKGLIPAGPRRTRLPGPEPSRS